MESHLIGCGIGTMVTPIVGDPDPNAARQIVCQYYCYPNDTDILVKSGTVLGITYTNRINYNFGQVLAENTQQTYGVCIATAVKFNFGSVFEVSCPMVPKNVSTTLLAGAGIG